MNARTQYSGGIEGYYYRSNAGNSSWVPKIFFEKDKWHVESRYNYEEQKTFSLIAGRSFSKEKKVVYSITPMCGFAVGNFSGVVTAMKIDLTYKSLFSSSESQYCLSAQTKNKNILYSWTDMGYQIKNWIDAGVALQLIKTSSNSEVAPGGFVNFSVKRWSFPIYFFSFYNKNRNLVCGISYAMGSSITKVNSSAPKITRPKNYLYE